MTAIHPRGADVIPFVPTPDQETASCPASTSGPTLRHSDVLSEGVAPATTVHGHHPAGV